MRRLIALPVCLSVLGAACAGGSSDEATIGSVPDVVESSPDAADVEAEAVPVVGVAPADAVVRVVTAGTFVSPDFGQLDSVAGSGSAFIIDGSGLAVTNNHVVAGAASVEVFFDGDDQPIAAAVVARSECSDLAVIDLAGDGYQALDWSTQPAEAGIGISAAGYPETSTGLTLTGGIVARVESDGATPWASIPSLLRHDADLAPGNSGGPILDADGRVVGVNVAASGSGRFAIPTSVAQPIVERLSAGSDVDSIGVNAVAVRDDVTNESGVWVVSVEAGSPAAAAGLQAGDVITRMKGIRVGRDATLADYCSVVRSTGDGELPVEIVRDGAHFAGSVRGATPLNRVLEVTDDIVATASEPPATVDRVPPAGTPYEAFETVTDDTGTISLEVPTAWTDQRTAPVFIGEADRPSISASRDFDALDASINTFSGGIYDQAGVGASVFSSNIDIEEAFDLLIENLSPWRYDCTPLGRETFDDGLYAGVMQAFMDCADTASTVFSFGIKRVGEPGWLFLNVFAPTIADLEAAVRIAGSYTFEAGALPPTQAADDTDGSNTPPATDPAPGSVPEESPTTTEAVVDESASQLPETMSASQAVVDEIGTPPASRVVESSAGYGAGSRTYRSSVSKEDLQLWMEHAMAAIGCVNTFVEDEPHDSVRASISCDVSRDGAMLVPIVMILDADDDEFDVVVSVLDFSVEV